jgi:iron(III) transport system substrate-binding protein
MSRGRLLMAIVIAVSLWGVGSFVYAQATDPRFENLAKELYPRARQEGEVIVYTIWDVADIVAVLDGFSKQFPGIKTKYWQADQPAVRSRVLLEFQSGQASVDGLACDMSVYVFRTAGAVATYETIQKDALILHDPTMPIVGLNVNVLAYNTKKMKAEDAPKDWEDVANAKFRGAVALDDPMRAGPGSVSLAALKEGWRDDARFARYVKGLKALNVPVHRSTAAMFRLMVAGEYSIANPAINRDVIEEKEKGSPVDYSRSAPPIVFPRPFGIYAKAPHPNAAKLLAEWLLSPAGQMVQDSVRKTMSRKGLRGKASIEGAWPSHIQPMGITDKAFLEDPKQWLDTFVKPIWEGK